MTLGNMPEIKLGVVGVSRDCFPIELTRERLGKLEKQLTGVDAHCCSVVIENEHDALAALDELIEHGCNALVVYLGNFGPEAPTTILVERFGSPAMVCAAAEENKAVLASKRGDALCGLLNFSYNANLRNVQVYIPQYPVGLPEDLALEIKDFAAIARVVIGVRNLKIIAFGPRPQDFFSCNAPIGPLYRLGVEVMENSELDLLQIYRDAGANKSEIQSVAAEMKKELGKGCAYPDLLPKLAQFEVALQAFMDQNLGASAFGAFANKCWPAFEKEFGFVPCYVNSRFAGRGVPAACEVDIYGALSEYMVQTATDMPATLLDINNSVPHDILPKKPNLKGATEKDLFMGFHCGNTCSRCMKKCSMKYQLIMNRLMEDGKPADITRGTLEGQIAPGQTTMFRMQSSPMGELVSYLAEGHILDIDPCSFGSIAVFAIPGFARFYRHILVGKHFPHHGAFGFRKAGKILYEAAAMLGMPAVHTPEPDGVLYDGENPFMLNA